MSELIPFRREKEYCYKLQLMVLNYYLSKKNLILASEKNDLFEKMNSRYLFELYNLAGELLFISANAKNVNSILDMAFEKSWRELYIRPPEVTMSLLSEVQNILKGKSNKAYKFRANSPHLIQEKYGLKQKMQWQGKWGWRITTKEEPSIAFGFLVVSDCKLV